MAQGYVAVCYIVTTVYCALVLSLWSFFSKFEFICHVVHMAKHFRPGHTPLLPRPSLGIRELETYNVMYARAPRLMWSLLRLAPIIVQQIS